MSKTRTRRHVQNVRPRAGWVAQWQSFGLIPRQPGFDSRPTLESRMALTQRGKAKLG